MFLTKIFIFDAAHKLTEHKGKCKNLHGHTYKLEVTVEGEVKEDGMVMDFNILEEIVNKKVIEKLDHSYLNEIIEVPTAEKVAIFIWDKLSPFLENLYEIKLWETNTSYVTLRSKI